MDTRIDTSDDDDHEYDTPKQEKEYIGGKVWGSSLSRSSTKWTRTNDQLHTAQRLCISQPGVVSKMVIYFGVRRPARLKNRFLWLPKELMAVH